MFSLVLAVALLSSLSASGAILKINHEKSRFCIERSGKPCPIDPAKEGWNDLKSTQPIEVQTGDLQIEVVSTNTAAFTATVTDEALEVKDIAALKAFIKGLKPYLVEGPSALIPPKTEKMVEVSELMSRYVKGIGAVDDQLKDIQKQLKEAQKASLLLTLGWNALASAPPSQVDVQRNTACQSLGLFDAAKEARKNKCSIVCGIQTMLGMNT